MKRFPLAHGTSLTLASLFGLALLGCGSNSGSPRKDGSTDTRADTSSTHLDDGGLDTSSDRFADQAPQGSEAGPPLLDGAMTDLPTPGADVESPSELDVAADTPVQPDLPQAGSDIGRNDDLAPSPDVPLGPDTPIAMSDAGQADSPLSVSPVDAAAVDGGVLDTSGLEASPPGVITGWPHSILDFGANPCGGESPAAQTFTLTNSGGSTVTITKGQFTGTSGYSSDAH